MPTSNSLAFRLNLILLFLALLLVGAGGSLGLVYMKMGIERSANSVRQLESTLAELERQDRFLDARLARAHQPRELMRRVAEAGLPLRASNPQQVVHVPGSFNPADIREASLVADRRMSPAHSSTSNRGN